MERYWVAIPVFYQHEIISPHEKQDCELLKAVPFNYQVILGAFKLDMIQLPAKSFH